MKRPLLVLVAMLVLSVAAVAIAEALHFGGLAWLGTLLAVMLLTGLVDRDYFYGPREPRQRS